MCCTSENNLMCHLYLNFFNVNIEKMEDLASMILQGKQRKGKESTKILSPQLDKNYTGRACLINYFGTLEATESLQLPGGGLGRKFFINFFS